MINETDLRTLAGNTVFSADLVKKDGSKRTMNCRFGTSLGKVGGSNNQENHNNLVTVYDMKSKGYRSINLDTAEGFTVKGKRYEK